MLRVLPAVFLLLLIQCKASKGVADDQGREDDKLFLEMSRTLCFGACPAYSVKIYESGKVEYEGEDFVPLKGKKEFTLEEEDLTEILNELGKLNFFELEDRYYKDVTDLPTTYLTVYKADQQKKVMDYYGAPQKLKRFEEFLEKAIFSYLN